MCLSTVFEEHGGEQTKLAEYVSAVREETGKITLTDIMGTETVVFGKVRSVDLVANRIIIEGAQSA